MRKDQSYGLLITAKGATPEPEQQIVWRFQDRDANWQVSVADSFVALDTRAYTSRTDFCARLGNLLELVEDEVEPLIFDRFGIRYINRLTGIGETAEVHEYVRRELLGGLAVPRHDGKSLQRMLGDAQFQVGDATTLQTRWGVLPSGTTTDPTIDPVDEKSWLLDIDVFTNPGTPEDFSAERLTELAADFANQAYRFFRWAMTDSFIEARRSDHASVA